MHERPDANRLRPLISRTFSWLPDGPIQRYFRAQVEAEYLGSSFDGTGELFLFVSGMLSVKTSSAHRRISAARSGEGRPAAVRADS